MDAFAPDDFWNRLAASRLVDAGGVDDLRRECTSQLAAAGGQPAATLAIAQWLVKRGTLTLWQARRLARGDKGPYFIGDYRLRSRLAVPGQGGLFQACHEPSGRIVQVAVLNTAACRQLATWTAIVRRTTTAHQAADPLLSRTWALEQAGSNRFIVCEDIPAATLADELAARGPMPVALAGELVLDVARAVAELHRLGEVHGAISLDALRRSPVPTGADPRDGRVRLAQFPLSGEFHQEVPRIAADVPEAIEALGRRAAFVAPELMLPGRSCDTRSDVYAIGCVFHALVTGSLPCWQGDPQRTLAQAAFVGVPPLAPPVVPVEIATLIGYLTARDPAGRYPSAVEAADAIAACLGRPPVSPTLPPQRPMAVSPSGPPAAAIQAAAPASGSVGESQPFATPSATFPELSAMPRGPQATPALPKTARRRRWLPLAGLGFAAASVAVVGTILWIGRPSSAPPATDDTPEQQPLHDTAANDPPAASETPAPPPETESAGEAAAAATVPDAAPAEPPATPAAPKPTLVDDPTLPWGSPTRGSPPTLAYLPPGSQLVLLVRPAEIAANEEGKRFMRALGPAVTAALDAAAKACGRGIDGIDMIQAGWLAAPDGTPIGGYAIHLREPADPDTIAAAAGAGPTSNVGSETLHAGSRFAWWLPTAAAGRVLVAGAVETVREIMEAEPLEALSADGLRTPLPRDMERLVGMLDRDRHITLFGAPHYLVNDGRGMLAGPLAKIANPLEEFFGDSLQAAALSLHFTDVLYAELDAVATVDVPAKRLAATLGGRLTALTNTVEEYCTALDFHPYGRKLVMRLPAMMRAVAASTRSGAEGKAAIVNCYLPLEAGHNLALATELALQQSPRSASHTTAAAAPPKRTAAAALAAPMTLSFPADTLEKSMQMIADEIGVPIVVLGSDLELDGITKNQSFGLDERDKPAAEILRTIFLKANPAGNLVYLIRKHDGGERIEVTTRAAAAKRGDVLPPEFAPADAPKPSSKK